MLAAWGHAIHRLRWWLVALSLLPLTLWLAVTPGERLDESVVPPDMESVRAVRLLDEELAPRRNDRRVARIRTPWDGPAPDPRSISADGRRAAVIVEVEGRAPAFASMVVPSAPPDLY